MTVIEKIQNVQMRLVLLQPFYASLLFDIEFIEDYSIKTCCINGKLIWYNPAFIDSLTKHELIGVLAHEILHVAYLHHTRRGDRNLQKWNEAADYAINSLLLDDDFVLPAGRLYNKLYEGMSAEQIYSILPDPHEQDTDPGGCGGVIDAPSDLSEEIVQSSITKAGYIAQAQKKCPDYIKRIIKDSLTPKINWRDALSQFLSGITRSDYSWKFPNPRYLQYGLYLPGLRAEEPGNVVLIIDTSASIDDDLISQFAAEIQEILSIFNISLTVIYCDELVRSVQYLEPNEPVKLEPKGGCGTDFVPGFDYIKEQSLSPRAVVYLTDGDCNTFPEPPDYHVLWAVYSYMKFKPPFGETITVKN